MSRWGREKWISTPNPKTLLIWVILVSIAIASCSRGLPSVPGPTEPEARPSETVEEIEIAVSTPIPTPTTETLPSRVVFLTSPDSDPLLTNQIQVELEDLVDRAGYRLEIAESLSAEEISPDIHWVVALPPDPGLEALAASTSETKFIAIGIPGLEERPNLVSLFVGAGGADLQGFMGGYIAALVTADWRIGAISISDTPEGVKAREGFVNGAIYFCGTCRQIYPPFFDSQNQLIEYPLYVELPATSSDQEWQSAADYLIERGVKTVFVYPEAGGESLLSYLFEADLNILGGTTPPEGLQEQWIASVLPEPSGSWRDHLEMTLLGQELPETSGQLQILHANPDLFSTGRQKLAGAVLEDLLSGYIEAGFVQEPIAEP